MPVTAKIKMIGNTKNKAKNAIASLPNQWISLISSLNITPPYLLTYTVQNTFILINRE